MEKQEVKQKVVGTKVTSIAPSASGTKISSGAYQQTVTPADLQLEQQAFV